MLRLFKPLFILTLLAVFFSACEQDRVFHSASATESLLQGSWKWVKIPYAIPTESWTFNKGQLFVYTFDGQNGYYPDTTRGTYEVQTTLSSPYVFIRNTPGDHFYEGRWTVIRLDKKVLSIVRGTQGTNAATQYEFIRQ